MLKVVHITWRDPCFAKSGWQSQVDFNDWVKEDLPPSDTVGILAFETANYVVLLQSIGDNQVADGVKISRSAIECIKELGTIPLSLKL